MSMGFGYAPACATRSRAARASASIRRTAGCESVAARAIAFGSCQSIDCANVETLKALSMRKRQNIR
jgi:hypothetical protein